MNEIVTIDTNVEISDIRPLICELRGQAGMLDRDLASLYHVMTGRLNEAVKRNIARFPAEFMFQLSDSEMRELIANCDRFKMMKHSPSRMYVFTEQGVAMLSAVLKSDIAIRESIRIMKAFVLMRRVLSVSAPSLVSLASRVEANERRQIEDLAKNERRFEEIHAKMSAEDIPLSQIFYQGKFWDAKSLLIKFIRRAKKELIVIDAYPGVATLDILAKRGRGVKIELITHSNGELEESDFAAFGAQCGKFTKTICGICHDRFIIVDGKEVFWTGASLKDAGRLTFAARMLVYPSGSAFAESSLRNASHFCGAFPRWARKSYPVFSIQPPRHNGVPRIRRKWYNMRYAKTSKENGNEPRA